VVYEPEEPLGLIIVERTSGVARFLWATPSVGGGRDRGFRAVLGLPESLAANF
jgi:hypothetical protein